MRAAKKNRARMFRYHREKTELAELRLESARLQAMLERLQQEERQLAPLSSVEAQNNCLGEAPSPFVNDSGDELDPREWMPPRATACGKRSSWKGTAQLECQRRRRAHVVRRKLLRLVKEYERQTDCYIGDWVSAQVLCNALSGVTDDGD